MDICPVLFCGTSPAISLKPYLPLIHIALKVQKLPVEYRPTPSGRCLFLPILAALCAFGFNTALQKDQPLCGCVLQTYFSFHLCACQSSILLRLCAQMSHRFFTTCGFMIDQHPPGVVFYGIALAALCAFGFNTALSNDQPPCSWLLNLLAMSVFEREKIPVRGLSFDRAGVGA